MAYQQYQTVCQPNAWTAICEYRPTRKSLFVQCPQVATLNNYSTASNVWLAAATAIAAANSLRRSLMVANSQAPRAVISVNSADALALNGINLSSFSTSFPPGAVQIDGSWGFWPQRQWFFVNASGGGTANCSVYEEIWQCRAIVLATTKNDAVSGPYGTAPPGNWLSSDLSAGPANFRLQEALDGEQVTQQWYAWPIGSVAVSVTTSEAWDVVIPPAPQKMFGVGVPRMSAAANSALDSLIAKMSMYDEEQ